MNAHETVIGQKTRFKGKVNTDGLITMNGLFEGEIGSSSDVLINRGAEFKGIMVCRNLTVHGKASGTVNCEKTMAVSSEGSFTGDASALDLDISPGADFDGKFIRKQRETKI